MIAATIEALSEALALAETNGVDRVEVMDMLKNTIFDCLIYRGYCPPPQLSAARRTSYL